MLTAPAASTPGESLDALDKLGVESADLFRLAVLLIGQGNAHGHYALGVEAGFDLQ